MAKILIIENQCSHLDLIYRKLEENDKHQPYPPKNERNIIDYVRVYLNVRYTLARRQQAWGEILGYFRRHAFDLLILDHRLVGSYDGKTGFYLVQQLRDLTDPADQQIRSIPVMFLSATRTNDNSVKKHIDKYPDVRWVEKGYAGVGIRDEEYFESHIRPKVEASLKGGIKLIQERIQCIIKTVNSSHIEDQIRRFQLVITDTDQLDVQDFLSCSHAMMHAATVTAAEESWKSYKILHDEKYK